MGNSGMQIGMSLHIERLLKFYCRNLAEKNKMLTKQISKTKVNNENRNLKPIESISNNTVHSLQFI